MARPKRIRHAHHELVPTQYVARYDSKGWLDRNFCIAGRWYLWRKNIPCDRGVLRLGVPDWDETYEQSLERS